MEHKWNSDEQSRSTGSTRLSRVPLYLGGALLLVIAGASLYSRWRKPEPLYQGKTAAQWFDEFEKASTPPLVPAIIVPSYAQSVIRLQNGTVIRLQNGTVIPSQNGTMIRFQNGVPIRDPGEARRERALGALRALGTNAGGYLGREFLRNDSPLGTAYWKLHSKTAPGLQKFLPTPPRPRNVVRVQVAAALRALGKDAGPAVPAIVAVLGSGESSKVRSAVDALGGIPFDPRLLEPVLEDWSRKGQYTNVYDVVSGLHIRTSGAAGSLARALKTGHAAFRRSCEYELEHFGPAAITALPELTAALADNDSEIRYGAARALEKLGPGGAPAIPALIGAMKDESIMVQRAAARALGMIAGQATGP